MFCHHCGAQLSEGAAFCGACGARVWMQTSSRFAVLKYDAAHARAHRAGASYGKMILRGLLYCLAPMLLMILGGEWIWAAFSLSMAGIAVLVLDCCLQRKYILASQSALVYDRGQRAWYYVTLFGDALAGFNTATRALAAAYNLANAADQTQRAQLDELMIGYVERFLEGRHAYNIWTGGEARVRRLKELYLVRQTPRLWVCGYVDAKGRGRTLKLPKGFPGWEEVVAP